MMVRFGLGLLLVMMAAACQMRLGVEPTGTPASTATTEPSATAVMATETPVANATSPLVVTPTGTAPALHFWADRMDVQPGEVLTLRWMTAQALSGTVAISLRAAHGAQPGLQDWRELPPAGSLDVPLDMDPRGRYQFMLSASFPMERPFYTLPFRFACPERFFFDLPANWHEIGPLKYDRCPAAAAHSPAALEQRFERGRMLWLQTDGLILILFGDGSMATSGNDWWSQLDTWTVAEPETDPRFAAPAGLWVPRRGFGKAWAENAEVRERLGWAMGPEVGFTSADQRDWDVPGIDSPAFRFVRAADGSVVALTDYAGHGVRPYWQVVVGP
jgi:hypothetical protein